MKLKERHASRIKPRAFNESLAIFIPNFAPGGAERVNVNLANSFAARGYEVDMVLMSATGPLQESLSTAIHQVDLHSPRVRAVLWPLVRYLRASKPDVLLANMWPLTVLAVLAKFIAGVHTRVVVAEHCTWSRSELLTKPIVAWQIRTSMHYVFPRSDAIVTVSQGAAHDLARFARLDRKSIKVIYNPVVEPSAPVIDQEECAPSDWWCGAHQRVLAVGTLKQVKAYDMLLNAFALLSANADVRLLILGEGEERAVLEAEIERLGLRGKVFMPGFVSDTKPYYKHADLHVLSSGSEGLPTVIIEALAAGTPVVSTDCLSGPREILSDGRYGSLVPVGDAQAFAEAMKAALLSPHDSEALKARAQDFSIEKSVDQYEALLFSSVNQ